MKKKRVSKVLAYFLTAALAASSAPYTAWGAELETVPDEEVVSLEEEEPLSVNSPEGEGDPVSSDSLADDEFTGVLVDGVNVAETTSGDGWTYEAETQTLRLDGYNGGPIVARQDLTVVLAADSTNIIRTDEGAGLGNGISFGTYYDLTVRGEESESKDEQGNPIKPILDVNGVEWAIQAVGEIVLENCKIITNNTIPNPTDGSCGAIFSENDLWVRNCTLEQNTNGVALTCFDSLTVEDSDIDITAGVVGIHANNENLTISNSSLNISGGSNAALQSRFGGVYLDSCTGSLDSEKAGISTVNLDRKYITQMDNCQLEITAPYGVMSYGDTIVNNGEVTFTDGNIGIYAYTDEPEKYTGDAYIKGGAVVMAENCQYAVQTPYHLTCEDTAVLNGAALAGNEVTLWGD